MQRASRCKHLRLWLCGLPVPHVLRTVVPVPTLGSHNREIDPGRLLSNVRSSLQEHVRVVLSRADQQIAPRAQQASELHEAIPVLLEDVKMIDVQPPIGLRHSSTDRAATALLGQYAVVGDREPHGVSESKTESAVAALAEVADEAMHPALTTSAACLSRKTRDVRLLHCRQSWQAVGHAPGRANGAGALLVATLSRASDILQPRGEHRR